MKILVCDDHALFREGLELVLGQLEPGAELTSVGDAESALERVAADDALDLVLLDLHLLGIDGFAALTGRQLEVLRLLARGLTNREIAGVLGIAEGTVKTHILHLYETLDVTNRTEAAMRMRELELEE